MLFQFVLDWWSVRQLQRAGIVFEPIYFAENEDTGRSGYGETYKEAYEYVAGPDTKAEVTILDMAIDVKIAWKCWHASAPTIKAFGLTKLDAYRKLAQFGRFWDPATQESSSGDKDEN